MRAHVYVLCVLILIGQLLQQLSIVLYQRLRLFYFLLNATVTNAYILYKESVQKRKLIMKEYVLRICEHLLSSSNCRKRSSVQDPPPAARLCECRFPDRLDKLQQCKACTDAEQEFAVRLGVLSDLLMFARLIASAYTTRNSTQVDIPNCTVLTNSHYISVYLCKLVWIIA